MGPKLGLLASITFGLGSQFLKVNSPTYFPFFILIKKIIGLNLILFIHNSQL